MTVTKKSLALGNSAVGSSSDRDVMVISSIHPLSASVKRRVAQEVGGSGVAEVGLTPVLPRLPLRQRCCCCCLQLGPRNAGVLGLTVPFSCFLENGKKESH